MARMSKRTTSITEGELHPTVSSLPLSAGSAAQQTIVEVIRSTWINQQIRNPSFSLRAFARRLGVAPAELSMIFNGKRRLTYRMATKLLSRIALEPEQARRLLEALPKKLRRNGQTREAELNSRPVLNYIQLSTDEFRVIADWYYLAILSLSETEGFVSDPIWIARRLGVRVDQIRTALEALLRLGLLTADGGQLRTTGKKFTTTNDVVDVSLRKNHVQGLELATQALHTVPVELREFGASIIAADPDLLPEAKSRLRELRREISRLLEGGRKKQVYRLQVQLFPVSQWEYSRGENHEN